MQNLPSLSPVSSLTQIQLISAFLSGRNQKTIQTYRQDLEDFRIFLNASSLDDAAQLLPSRGHGEANALALTYKTSLINRNLQAATINRRLAALHSLVKLARTLGLIPWILEVENMKAQSYRDARGPGRTGFKAMLDQAADYKKEKSIRDQAILRLLFDLGLRRGEVVALDMEDVDLPSGTLLSWGRGRLKKFS